jgi:hypothetical protein
VKLQAPCNNQKSTQLAELVGRQQRFLQKSPFELLETAATTAMHLPVRNRLRRRTRLESPYALFLAQQYLMLVCRSRKPQDFCSLSGSALSHHSRYPLFLWRHFCVPVPYMSKTRWSRRQNRMTRQSYLLNCSNPSGEPMLTIEPKHILHLSDN